MEKPPLSFDVCIVCALPEEARAFLEVAQQHCEDTLEERSSPRYQYSYRSAVLKNDEDEPLTLHISWLPRYGPQEMTLHLSRVLEECQPRIAIMTGMCAGDAQQVQLGDLVVADRTFTYDNGKFMFDEQGRAVHLHDTLTYQLDANILQFLGLFDNWKPLIADLQRPPSSHESREIACHLKAMASGSAVRADHPFEDIRAPVRGTVAIDMEGAAFGLILSRHPLSRWLIVKSICDYADQNKSDAYHDYAARASAIYALSFIRAYVTQERLPRSDIPSSDRVQLPRIWNVPYRRNPFFTGRDQELEHLHLQLRQSHTAAVGQTQAISGLGGIGKTQLAVEYAYRHHDEYQYVLWARTENIEALTSSYTEIARLLDLPEKDAQEPEIAIQAVKRWLQRKRDWLLILDNADVPDLLPAYLPPTAGGHLLITTRAADLSHLNLGIADPFNLQIFSPEQGALFLLSRAGYSLQATSDEHKLAQQLSAELGGLPLALDQAGAYIKATGNSLERYWQLFKQYRTELLKEHNNQEYPNSVATTWNVSFKRIEELNPIAADLLRLCAFLAPDAIPEEILTEGTKRLGRTSLRAASNPIQFDRAVALLRSYSLLSRNSDNHTLNVHRLVQAVVRDILLTHKKPIFFRNTLQNKIKQKWMKRAVSAVNAVFPHPEFEQWSICERLLPHALICAAWIEQTSIQAREAAHLLNSLGYYLRDRGRYAEANSLFQRAIVIYVQREGNNLGTAQSLNNLAALSMDQGEFFEAEVLYTNALAIYEKRLRPSHPATANCLNNLAELYRKWRRFEEAELLFQRALSIREQKLGLRNPLTLTTLNNLALLHMDQGKSQEAELLFQRVLTTREQELGPLHPDIAQSLNNLAILCMYQKKFVEAEPLLQRALAIHEQTSGPFHPNTATSINNLANLYIEQGKLQEAKPLFQRALAIYEQALGDEHPDTQKVREDYAYLQQRIAKGRGSRKKKRAR